MFGLIGKPLSHSFSKKYFEQKFIEENIIDCSYELFELQSIDELPKLISSNPRLKGLNVTIPYKEAVLPLLHHKNEIVTAIGACNCIKIVDEELYGFNTDVIGFKKSLLEHLSQHHKKALVLGSGGAAKAIQYVLNDLRIEYLLVSRNKKEEGITYQDLNESIIVDHTLIINTTPLGTYPNVGESPNIPYQFLSKQHFLFDVVYNPSKTKFLEEGEKRGAQILNGYEMLVYQAEESWKIWNP
jgi:shikimate dehydrogenase